jgi:hypothetical protein
VTSKKKEKTYKGIPESELRRLDKQLKITKKLLKQKEHDKFD